MGEPPPVSLLSWSRGGLVIDVHMTVLKAAYWVITSPVVPTGLASGVCAYDNSTD